MTYTKHSTCSWFSWIEPKQYNISQFTQTTCFNLLKLIVSIYSNYVFQFTQTTCFNLLKLGVSIVNILFSLCVYCKTKPKVSGFLVDF